VDVAMVAPKSPGHRVRCLPFTAMPRVMRDSSRCRTPVRSAPHVPGSSRRRSRRRRRPICLANRPSCAAASARSSQPASRRSWTPAISRRSPTSSVSTS
jgi:hypothetical protein